MLRHREAKATMNTKQDPKDDGMWEYAKDQILEAEKKLERALLCIYDELPDWQKDNHFIISGYVRETLSFKKTFASLGYIHNETVNIYSHLVPSLVVLAALMTFAVEELLPEYPTTSWRDRAAMLCFCTGLILCLGMSGTFHTLKSHSESVAAFGNKLDYLGIVVLIATSMFSLIYYGMIDHPKFQEMFWAITGLLGTICTIVALFDKFRRPEWRAFRASMFVAYGLSGVLPVVVGCFIYGVRIAKRLFVL
jgi:adiponectin receptor